MQAAAEAAQAAVAVAGAATASSSRRAGVDSRALEKPRRFAGNDTDAEDREFPEWRFSFVSWLVSQ